jgi:hypothetical protein
MVVKSFCINHWKWGSVIKKKVNSAYKELKLIFFLIRKIKTKQKNRDINK